MSRIRNRGSHSTPSRPDRSQSAFPDVDAEREPLEFDLEKELIVAFGSAEAGSSKATAVSSKDIVGSEMDELDEEDKEEEEKEEKDGVEMRFGDDDVMMAVDEDGHGSPGGRGGQDHQLPTHLPSSRSPLFVPRSSSDPLAIDSPSPSPSRSPSFELLDEPGSSASTTPRPLPAARRREGRRNLMPFVEIPLLPLRVLREYALVPPASHPTSQSRQRLLLSPSQSPSPSNESDFEIISPELRLRTTRNKAMRTRSGAGATVHTRADTRTRTQTRTRGRARSGTSDQLMSDGSKEFGGYGSEDEDEEEGSGAEDSEAGSDEMMLRRSKRGTRGAAMKGKREELDRTRKRTRAVARRSVSTIFDFSHFLRGCVARESSDVLCGPYKGSLVLGVLISPSPGFARVLCLITDLALAASSTVAGIS
jgi:hypothetical protein